MKKILSLLSLAALTIGLLGSCSKINERIDNLEKRVDGIEATSIASVQQQIDGIKASITKLEAADVTVNGKIDELKATAETHQTLIDALKEADKALGQKDDALEARIATLEGQVTTINGQIDALVNADIAINTRIDQLKSYVDTEIGKTKDWAEATFATLGQYQQTADDLAALSVTVTGISTTLTGIQTSISGLDTRIDSLDTALQGRITTAKTELEGMIADLQTELEGRIADAITASETSIKTWINELLEGYYTIAQVDAQIGSLNTAIEAAKGTAKERIDSVATELTELKTAVDTAKANIRTEYKNAIDVAINKLDGEIRGALLDSIAAVNGRIEALDTRVKTLEGKVLTLEGNVDKLLAMIQSVTILPAYTDGSLEAVDNTLTIDFVVSPAAAVKGVTKDSIKVLVHQAKVQTKAASYESLSIESADVNEATGDVTITANISKITPAEGKALTVAVNIKNGISDFTTEFVPVESHFTYAEIAGVKWALENLAVSESGKREFKNTGHVIGDYFQWATYAGYCGDASGSDKGLLIYTSFTSKLCGDTENAFSFKDASYQFSIPDWGEGIAPYCTEDEGYTKYTGDAVSTLESTDDAATIILGEEWRMPTIEEYQSLYNATYWAWDATDCGYYVFLPSDAPGKSAGSYGEITGLNKSKAKLFFPASGYVDYTSISETPCAQYLSSSYEPYEFMPGYLSKKFKFDMMSTPPAIDLDLNVMPDRRSCGASIRPVKAATAE